MEVLTPLLVRAKDEIMADPRGWRLASHHPKAASTGGGVVQRCIVLSWRMYTTSWTEGHRSRTATRQKETKKYNNQPVNDLTYTSADAYLARDKNAGGNQNKKYGNQPVNTSAYAG